MNTYLAAVLGVGVAAAVLLGIGGLQRRPDRPRRILDRADRRPGLLTRLRRYAGTRAGRRRLVLVGVAAGVGLVIMVVTGFWAMVVLLPLTVVAVAGIFFPPPTAGTEVLEALDRWIRSINQSLPIGRDVAGAIRASALSAPDVLKPVMNRVVGRLNIGMRTDQALLMMADELADPEVDAVLASLILASRRTGGGLGATLDGIADSIQDKLRALRAVKTERDRPRQTVRIVTVMGVVMILGAGVLLNYFAAYATPVGQVVLTVLVGAYFATVLAMNRLTTTAARPRILGGADQLSRTLGAGGRR